MRVRVLFFLFTTACMTACGGGSSASISADREGVITPALLQQHLAEDARIGQEESDDSIDVQVVVGAELESMDMSAYNWHSVLMTGDDSIRAFDNARKNLAQQFQDAGVAAENISHLSRDSGEVGDGVLPTSEDNLRRVLMGQNIGSADACSLFMTSHGTRSGFYVRGQSYLTPSELDAMLDEACGDQPQVVLVSACYSGVFAEPVMRQPNRIVLTAARKDRTSFGCSPGATYTYWDGCMIEHFGNHDEWLDLAENVRSCIEEKERAGGYTPSGPQIRIGDDMTGARIFYK